LASSVLVLALVLLLSSLGSNAAKSFEISPSSPSSSSAQDLDGWKGRAVGLSPDMFTDYLRRVCVSLTRVVIYSKRFDKINKVDRFGL
jgi:hypothetical protein